MNTIARVELAAHPVLGNLELDFRLPSGKPADTIIIAGENGIGKSVLISELYSLISGSARTISYGALLSFTGGQGNYSLVYSSKRTRASAPTTYVDDDHGMKVPIGLPDYHSKYPMSAIYSDVDIDFRSKQLSTVTSLELDSQTESKRSTGSLPTEIEQLIIDIQTADNTDLAHELRRSDPETKVGEIAVKQRMTRFTRAFSLMFDDLSFKEVENRDGHKEILFEKNGAEVPISGLSSGEKQIVYRGGFLLRDANAMAGAFVFIDEPEISLHPSWQDKILGYYRAIFSDEQGRPTSQLFVVTHSPFIVQADRKPGEKVIVLARSDDGTVKVLDRPEYYGKGSIAAVQDAFDMSWYEPTKPVVYVEGQTDERYFRRALELLDHEPRFTFKWVGRIDDSGQERNTGSTALSKAFDFLIAQGLPTRNACLFDCDTKHEDRVVDRTLAFCMPKYKNSSGMEKGIENALVLDSLDITSAFDSKTSRDDYGGKTETTKLNKMRLCELICALEDEGAAGVFVNLVEVIGRLEVWFMTGVWT